MTDYDFIIKSEYGLSVLSQLPSGSEGKSPAIVMIHGSSSDHRHENTKKLKINTFKEITTLANEVGFATIRYK